MSMTRKQATAFDELVAHALACSISGMSCSDLARIRAGSDFSIATDAGSAACRYAPSEAITPRRYQPGWLHVRFHVPLAASLALYGREVGHPLSADGQRYRLNVCSGKWNWMFSGCPSEVMRLESELKSLDASLVAVVSERHRQHA